GTQLGSSVSATSGDASTGAGASLAIPGGSNSTSGSLGTVQAGGGNSASGSFVRAQSAGGTAGLSAALANGGTTLGLAFDQSLQPSDSSLGNSAGLPVSPAAADFLQTLMFPLSFGLGSGAPSGSLAQAMADLIELD